MVLRGPAPITHILEDEQPRLIQGQEPASQGEARVATSLDKYRHRYIYQYTLIDIKGVRGAYRIDFLVLSTTPHSTPLEVFDEYWHEGRMGQEDRLRLAQIENHFRGRSNRVAIIWGAEVQTQSDSDDVVLRKVGPA